MAGFGVHLATEAPHLLVNNEFLNTGEVAMSEQQFQYDTMVQEALRNVVREALEELCKDGFRGEHHFYITFKTQTPDVILPNFLHERYPEEMTIVLQHQFWNLQVKQAHFEVELSFNDKRENLVIPFKSITGFADPSVKFGLQFDDNIKADLTSDEKNDANELAVTAQYLDEKSKNSGEVVSLDQFRKKTDGNA